MLVFGSLRPPGQASKASGLGRLARRDSENGLQRLKYISFRLRHTSWATGIREARPERRLKRPAEAQICQFSAPTGLLGFLARGGGGSPGATAKIAFRSSEMSVVGSDGLLAQVESVGTDLLNKSTSSVCPNYLTGFVVPSILFEASLRGGWSQNGEHQEVLNMS